MATISLELWQFVVEWYDPLPQLKKQYLLKYYVEKHSVELIDLKNKKIFLKKCPCPPEIASTDLFIGSKILLYARELEIVDYGDDYTRNKLQQQLQPSIAILTSKTSNYWGRFLDKISSVLQVKCVRTIYLSDSAADEVGDYLKINQRKLADLTAGPCLLVSIHAEDGIRELELQYVIPPIFCIYFYYLFIIY